MTKNYFTDSQVKEAVKVSLPWSKNMQLSIPQLAEFKALMNLAVEAAIGEPIGKIESTDADDYSTQYWGELDMKAFGDGKWKTGDKLYTTPQQPQTVADALEEAAKICDDYANSNFGSLVDSGQNGAYVCSQAIRDLIKRNATKEGE